MLQQRGPCGCFFLVAPLPPNDISLGYGDQQAPSAPDIDSVDLDLVKNLAGSRKTGMDVPAPCCLVAEGPAGSSAEFCLRQLAHEPADEAGELVACGRVFSFVSGAGVAIFTSPALCSFGGGAVLFPG